MRQLLIALPLILSACGAVYTVPKVDENADNVKVVEMNFSNIAQANASAFTPRPLPAAFDQSIQANITVPRIPSPDTEIATRIPPRAPNELYRIGVSDVLRLSTPSPSAEEEITGVAGLQNQRQGFVVQDDGRISLPNLGRIDVSGLSLQEAESTIFNAMVDRQIDPKFSLEISEFNSQSVSVGGLVGSSGVLPISIKPMTLNQALQQSGGVSIPDPRYAIIRMKRDGQDYQLPYSDFLKQASLQNIKLMDGDNITIEQDANVQAIIAETQLKNNLAAQQASEVRTSAAQKRSNFRDQLELGAIQRDYVYLAGEVSRQDRFPLPFGAKANLADAVFSSSGIPTTTGDVAEIYLLRIKTTDGAPITAYHVDASNPVNLLMMTKMELRPDDVVFVATQKITSWNRVLSQVIPTAGLADRLAN